MTECPYCRGYPTAEEFEKHKPSECICQGQGCGAGGCPRKEYLQKRWFTLHQTNNLIHRLTEDIRLTREIVEKNEPSNLEPETWTRIIISKQKELDALVSLRATIAKGLE